MTPPESSGEGEVKLEEDAPATAKLEASAQEQENEGWTKVEKRKGKKHKKTEGKQDVCVGFYVVCCSLC